MELNLSFFKNKRVFLTGNTGFKGSWLTLILNELGALVHGYSLKADTHPNMYTILKLESVIKQTFDDIRNYDALCASLKKFNPDIIIHLAAQPLVRESYDKPKYTYETNVMGTVNLLEVAKELNSLSSILVITSDKCYKNREIDYAYSENDSLGGHDPYSSSKACADIIASSYYNSFFSRMNVGLATARAGNIIGGGDWTRERLIPDAIRAFSKGKILEVRSPNAIRPWQYILDPLFGYLSLIEYLNVNQNLFSGPWNFGPPKKSNEPVRYICKSMLDFWGEGAKWVVEDSKNKYHEAKLLMLDSSKSMSKIKWSSKFDTSAAIKRTIKWYKRYYNEMDMLNFTKNEIYNYMKQ